VRIRAARADDAAAIASIYAPFVRDSAVSFEAEPPGAAAMLERMAEGDGLYPWLVAEEDGTLAGYAYACAFRSRFAYRFAVETTVYLRQGCEGYGLGSALYRPLLASSRRKASPRRSPPSPFPMTQAPGCTRRWGSNRPAPTAASAGSSARGGTSAFGKGRSPPSKAHRKSLGLQAAPSPQTSL
jgi:GNAT superfamily N-acetyltransferase